MNMLALLGSSAGSLFRNKTRSLLTVLGITIGIAATICVVAIGRAAQRQVEQQLSNLGDNLVWIERGGRAVNGVRTGTQATTTLMPSDAATLKEQMPLLKTVAPDVNAGAQVVYGNKNWYTLYRGDTLEFFAVKRWAVTEGTLFTQDDIDSSADVCVLGRTVQDELFGGQDPIGLVVRVLNLPCKVIGTLERKGIFRLRNGSGRHYHPAADHRAEEIDGRGVAEQYFRRGGFARCREAGGPAGRGDLARPPSYPSRTGGRFQHPQSRRRHSGEAENQPCPEPVAGNWWRRFPCWSAASAS